MLVNIATINKPLCALLQKGIAAFKGALQVSLNDVRAKFTRLPHQWDQYIFFAVNLIARKAQKPYP